MFNMHCCADIRVSIPYSNLSSTCQLFEHVCLPTFGSNGSFEGHDRLDQTSPKDSEEKSVLRPCHDDCFVPIYDRSIAIQGFDYLSKDIGFKN